MDTEQIDESRFQFVDDTHEYLLDGKPLTGTTTVIKVLAKPALIPWAANMAVGHIKDTAEQDEEGGWYVTAEILEQAKKAHSKKADDAAQKGTDVHAIVEGWINNLLSNYDGVPQNDYAFDLDDQILKFKEWALSNVDHFLFSERQMYNEQYWFAGTADFAYVGKDGKKYMADFKTSSGIWDEYWYQVAAYRFLAESMGDEPYDGQVIVRLGKDNKFEVKQTTEYTLFKDAFFNCLGIYRAQAKQKSFIV
jgi:hypothetical protein